VCFNGAVNIEFRDGRVYKPFKNTKLCAMEASLLSLTMLKDKMIFDSGAAQISIVTIE
jgi:hypothetical protein